MKLRNSNELRSFSVLGHADISNAPCPTTMERLIFEQRLSLYTRFSKIPMTF
jgi:hypothetical protein